MVQSFKCVSVALWNTILVSSSTGGNQSVLTLSFVLCFDSLMTVLMLDDLIIRSHIQHGNW